MTEHLKGEGPVPNGWLESLGRSKVEIADGKAVSLALIVQRIRKKAARLEAEAAPDETVAPTRS